jgi:ankyrin repeat protein
MGSFESLETKYLNSCNNGNTEELIKYLDQGVDVNARDYEGNNSALLICRHGDISMLEFVVSKGALLARNNMGWSPLLVAAEHGRLSMVIHLLGKYSGIHEKNNFGSTALICAAEHGYLELVDLLLIEGAVAAETDIFGRTASDWANGNNHLDVAHRIHMWPVTMAIILLLELEVFYLLDFYSIVEIYRFSLPTEL